MHARANASRDRALWASIVVTLVGLVGVVLALTLPIATKARIAIGATSLLAFAWSYVTGRRHGDRASGIYVESTDEGLVRVTPEGTKELVRWDAPFGVALLATYGRPTALLAFTTETQTRYVPTRIDERSEVDADLFARIAVLADLDFVDGVAHEAALSAADASALLRHVEEKNASALGRVFLSDSRRTPISFDRSTLAIGDRSFDLESHVEWRPLRFHESNGQALALYQGTWIRQGTSEVVLVAPMPATLVPRDAQRDARGDKLSRALTRDRRLLQAPDEPPPPRDMRVAMDRPFMLAVRRMLDDAPLAARVSPDIPARTRSEGHGSRA